VIIPDANLLLYATIDASVEHDAACQWLDDLMNGNEPVGLAAPVLFGFIRIATNPRVFKPPLPVDDAISRVESWLARPHVHFLMPGSRHLEIAFRMLRDVGVAGDLTTDAQLAALAIEHQAELHSNDTDFGRFPQLKWVNPL
jgi:uncharacterized protein